MPRAAKVFGSKPKRVGKALKRFDQRPSAAKRGYGRRWQKTSKAFLAKHPTCNCDECVASGFPRASRVVDHKVPHRGDMKLFWKRENWQAMAKKCHDKKTAREDGGFGNKNGV